MIMKSVKELLQHSPGVVLGYFIDYFGTNQRQLAKHVGVSFRTISVIINNRRPISPDMAIRLGRAFDMRPEFWLQVQANYDVDILLEDKDKKADYNKIKIIPKSRKSNRAKTTQKALKEVLDYD